MAGKHTAGPWSVYSWDDKGTPVIGVKPVEGGGDVADCSVNNWRGIEVLQANARLIAAAPDLLEVLVAIQADQSWRTNDNSLWPRINEVIRRATQPLPPPNEDQP